MSFELERERSLVLASGSPRRRMLLAEAGIAFEVVVPEIEEWSGESHPEFSASQLARLNAERKAAAVVEMYPGRMVLAADTVVVLDGLVLGKPRDVEDAVRMLGLLSGRTHEVVTGVAWYHPTEKKIRAAMERTYVTFRDLDDGAIRGYVRDVDVMDKAGAYALQEEGARIVERVEGSRTNVIGLPMEIVLRWWREQG